MNNRTMEHSENGTNLFRLDRVIPPAGPLQDLYVAGKLKQYMLSEIMETAAKLFDDRRARSIFTWWEVHHPNEDAEIPYPTARAQALMLLADPFQVIPGEIVYCPILRIHEVGGGFAEIPTMTDTMYYARLIFERVRFKAPSGEVELWKRIS